ASGEVRLPKASGKMRVRWRRRRKFRPESARREDRVGGRGRRFSTFYRGGFAIPRGSNGAASCCGREDRCVRGMDLWPASEARVPRKRYGEDKSVGWGG